MDERRRALQLAERGETLEPVEREAGVLRLREAIAALGSPAYGPRVAPPRWSRHTHPGTVRLDDVLALVDPAIPASENEGLREIDWPDVMMDALRQSDGGNNPFYSDDDDTVSLAHQLAEAVVARLPRPA